jgi:transcriptional regulator with XRE-family HTH domain
VPKVPALKVVLKTVAQRIRNARVAAGLTQEKAAAEAGIGYKRYQRIEGGGVNLTLRTLHRIAKALHADYWHLVSGNPPADDKHDE